MLYLVQYIISYIILYHEYASYIILYHINIRSMILLVLHNMLLQLEVSCCNYGFLDQVYTSDVRHILSIVKQYIIDKVC
jgi:hypothetical protein